VGGNAKNAFKPKPSATFPSKIISKNSSPPQTCVLHTMYGAHPFILTKTIPLINAARGKSKTHTSCNEMNFLPSNFILHPRLIQ